MKRNISIRVALLVLAVSMVLPVNTSVKNLLSNRVEAAATGRQSGSPIPAPTPPRFSVLAVSGSPIPAPRPPGLNVLTASGSPIPAPTPPGFTNSAASGSPIPAPVPPGRLT